MGITRLNFAFELAFRERFYRPQVVIPAGCHRREIHIVTERKFTTFLLPIPSVNECLRVYFGAVSGVACC